LKALVVGGSGGIGRAVIHHLVSTLPDITVYATYNSTLPRTKQPNVIWFKTNASSEADVEQLASNITELDMLINTVGFLHTPDYKPERTVNELDLDFFQRNLSANTIPTLLLAKYFSGHLKASQQTYFVSLSARIGSIEDNKLGGWISYRCSKAALNMAIKTISIEWKRTLPNCCVFAFHPGTTDTALSKPFQQRVPPNKLFSAEYVAEKLFKIIENAQPADSGKFFSFTGEQLPW